MWDTWIHNDTSIAYIQIISLVHGCLHEIWSLRISVELYECAPYIMHTAVSKSRTHASSRPTSPCRPVTPDLQCHTCNAQPARRGPNTAPPTAAQSCCIHCARTASATHNPPFSAPHSTLLPSATCFACHQRVPMHPPGSDCPHSTPTPPHHIVN